MPCHVRTQWSARSSQCTNNYLLYDDFMKFGLLYRPLYRIMCNVPLCNIGVDELELPGCLRFTLFS